MKLHSLILAAAMVVMVPAAYAQTTPSTPPAAPTVGNGQMPLTDAQKEQRRVEFEKHKAMRDQYKAQHEGQIAAQDEKNGNIKGAERAQRKEQLDEHKAEYAESKESIAKRRLEHQAKRDDFREERGNVNRAAEEQKMQARRQEMQAKWQNNKVPPAAPVAPVTGNATQ